MSTPKTYGMKNENHGWQEEYDFPFRTDGKLNPEYTILGVIKEEIKIKV